ncbi:3-hydroxyacyl-[acyl-carrier-protein] dehydratase /UDP-3-O-[3-hydroxymyristoyl] N-acetylglucosamine deacetylase [Verrucomicrobium sp. GAS474]|uniref:bifunctional UDP-3-O-[3-hydroxymyristoyl] N-acetylglucosamine deacetylase/3-hydroxyacyl-ACP dehydratase n=1 Tax=Verrucomicrobium sp. GAS474 TaxID=1882831 RepID=UPI00087A9579|nr:bifunctional UDP-3-O-[3-hydroxymyristoyl] N-acetylglucosamine deacetylase/3-hydroxyacyl-ACP dehydratase [Verrucomicrobium sp. GAS474]SDT96717.1 3-hydroxyacyl-[acyl-carrier-protein] dehydratase /UDP-3-O-[3-hydroxymyristoyl] N-acetylglucosamine deacetylase [Verrucomicrobium sp. GAS474]
MPPVNQKTLKKDVTVQGTALHTGNKVTLTLKPAAPDTGYVFKRVDLPDEPTVPVHIDGVKTTERATTLGEGNVKIHTVEHVLASLRGNGIDNAVIELDANEAPIGDGSGSLFVNAIAEAGIEEQEAKVSFYELREPVCVEGKDGAHMAAWPSDTFQVTCTNANHTGSHTQFLHWKEDTAHFSRDLGRARTFVFHEEVQPLLDKGLIKGGSLDNAIVIKGDSIISKEPLRYPDEFVRHKIFDIVGDLTLFPKRLKAHIVASKPSHGLNVELAKAIWKQYRNYLSQLMPVENIPSGEGGLDINGVMKILPHRYPFLMVDRILGFDGENKAVGQKSVTINEPFFQGHFPGHPVMPGVLQVEAMAQVASILMLRQAENAGRLGYFMSVDKAKFRRPVMPGDVLHIEVELTKSRSKIGKARGQCLVNGQVVSEAEMVFALIDG